MRNKIKTVRETTSHEVRTVIDRRTPQFTQVYDVVPTVLKYLGLRATVTCPTDIDTGEMGKKNRFTPHVTSQLLTSET